MEKNQPKALYGNTGMIARSVLDKVNSKNCTYFKEVKKNINLEGDSPLEIRVAALELNLKNMMNQKVQMIYFI